VLPSGLATDHGSRSIRRRLLTECDVDAIVGIDNHRGVFPIHRSVRFLLVTATPGSSTARIACRFGLDQAAALERIDGGGRPDDDRAMEDHDRSIVLTPTLLERISGPDLAIPALRSAVDLAIVERAASLFPPLGGASGWSATFGRELNATEDRAAFYPMSRLKPDLPEPGGVRLQPDLPKPGGVRLQPDLPVVEGKHLQPFRVALNAVAQTIRTAEARRLLKSDRFTRARLAYRDVAGATNKLTLIAAVLPGGCISTHTVFCLRTPLGARAQHFLCGLFNSLVVNYLVRLRVTTHVTTATVERLPIPRHEIAPRTFREIAALARVLSRRSDPELLAVLNARVADLYCLSAAEFEHVLATFPLVPREERHRAFKIFAATNQ